LADALEVMGAAGFGVSVLHGADVLRGAAQIGQLTVEADFLKKGLSR